MKLILISFLLVFSISTRAQNTKTEKIKKLLEVSGSATAAKTSMEGMINAMKGNTNGLPDGFLEAFQKEIDFDVFIDMYVPIYDKYFTENEITEMIALYETPIGKKMIEKMPLILSESMQLGQEWGQKIAMKVLGNLKEK